MRNTRRFLGFNLAVLLVLAFAGACLTGCATSVPFAQGLKATGPKLLPDVKHYAKTDEQKAQATALETALADPAKATRAGVEKAWNDVLAWYGPAFAADPVVTSDPDRLKLRQQLVDDMNKLIAHEKARPLGLGG